MSVLSLRNKILRKLEQRHNINEDFVVDQLAIVIKGEKIEETYEVDDSGTMHLIKMRTTRNPKDIMAGLAVFDNITSGVLALDSAHRSAKQIAQLYNDFLPHIPDGSTGDVVQRPFIVDLEKDGS